MNNNKSNKDDPLGTFVLDFQTTTFDQDVKIADEILSNLQSKCNLENQFAIDPPMERAGWAFAKIFMSGQFVEKIRDGHGYEIEKSKGRKFEDRFVTWLANELKRKECKANIKLAPEMKEL